MTPLAFVVCCLAAARITRLLVIDNGPGNIISSMRRWLGAEGGSSEPNELAKLFNCPFCMSFWVGPAVVAAAGVHEPVDWALGGLAVSFASGFLVAWSTPYEV